MRSLQKAAIFGLKNKLLVATLLLLLLVPKAPLPSQEHHQTHANSLISPHMRVSNYADALGEQFEAKVLYLLDEVNGNFLFRGNLPEKNGQFCYTDLIEAMNTYLKEQGKSLPKAFTLLDLSFLNYIKEKEEIEVEQEWCASNKNLGTFWLNSLYGAEVDPLHLSKNVRDFTLKHHDIDGLKALMSKIRHYLESTPATPLVIYMHCAAGKDRTGEAAACYLMQFKKYSYDSAMSLDTKVAGREVFHAFKDGIRWYAFYLRDLEHLPTIGSIDGK